MPRPILGPPLPPECESSRASIAANGMRSAREQAERSRADRAEMDREDAVREAAKSAARASAPAERGESDARDPGRGGGNFRTHDPGRRDQRLHGRELVIGVVGPPNPAFVAGWGVLIAALIYLLWKLFEPSDPEPMP